MWKKDFELNGKQYHAQGEKEDRYYFGWREAWTVYGYENDKPYFLVKALVISPETELPEIIERNLNGKRKRYFIREEGYKFGRLMYRLRYAYRDSLEEYGFKRITRKEAELLARKERTHRREDPEHSGYADMDIYSAYKDYLSL